MTSVPEASLARSITWSGSRHTYLIIRWLADADLADDAFRAYAYFRWVDDILDGDGLPRPDRLAFLERQRTLLSSSLRRSPSPTTEPEEELLTEVLRSECTDHPGLRSYLTHMMAVMEFDAWRRGRTVSSHELTSYTQNLSQAVMGGLSYFVGHRSYYPATPDRLLAVSGAHIVHMLRDAAEDVRAGYYNVPREFLEIHRLAPDDLQAPAYFDWLRRRLLLARRQLTLGRGYIMSLADLRVRLAGLAYTYRFLMTLRGLEADIRLRQPAWGVGATSSAAPRAMQDADARLVRSPGAPLDKMP